MVVALPPIEVEALRASATDASAPYALAIKARDDDDLKLETGLALDGVLDGLPGLVVADRGHYALGERVLVRGMGWAAAFGVRGVQVLLDGIPLTLPDGQAVIEVADPAFIRRAELVRGPSSSLWGNASGGVLLLSTTGFRDTSAARIRAMAGPYGGRQFSGEAAGRVGEYRIHGHASTTHSDGYREHSEGRLARGTMHLDVALAARTRVRAVAAFVAQDVLAPGALTASELAADRRQADPRNVAAGAGKTSTQVQAGLTLLHETGVGSLSATAFGIIRRLDNPLSFAYIDVDRGAGGLRVLLRNEGDRFDFGVGVDAGYQNDDRFNFNNDDGSPGDETSLSQREIVRNLSGFAYGRIGVTSRLTVTPGARVDVIRFDLRDRLAADGDQSGRRVLPAVSPALGLGYRYGSAFFFANASTAFESPTTTELVNTPDGSAGLNPEVGAQRTVGFELGARGTAAAGRIDYEVAAFRLDVRDRLLPFQDEDGRTYYRGAGDALHRGVEIAVGVHPTRALGFDVSYTGGRYELNGSLQDGERIPGVPDHMLHAAARLTHRDVTLRLGGEYISDVYANEANTATSDGRTLLDVGIGHSGLAAGAVRVQPFLRLANVFDATYSGSIVVNAFGGRYYEPVPGRALHIGVGVEF